MATSKITSPIRYFNGVMPSRTLPEQGGPDDPKSSGFIALDQRSEAAQARWWAKWGKAKNRSVVEMG